MKSQGEMLTLPANQAGGDIARGLRVKLDSGVLAVAGLAERELGTIQRRYVSAGLGASTTGNVLARNAPGTRLCIASEALAVGAVVHTAAGGKVSDTAAATSFPYGTALTAATADGDEIEVLPFGGFSAANA